MQPEVSIKKPSEKGVAIWAGGGSCERAVQKIELAGYMHAFDQWQCCGLLDKSQKECLKREEKLAQLSRDFSSQCRKDFRGREFRHFICALGGPGEQLMKDPQFAIQLLPYWWQDVSDFVREMSAFITGVGGAHMGWAHLSSGGHSIPLLVATFGLARGIIRPQIQIAEIVWPTAGEKEALAIFRGEAAYMFRNDFLGFDAMVVVNNNCANAFRSLKELDVLASIATTAPLASNPPRSKLHYLEVWSFLSKAGRVIGIWARKVPVLPVGVPKHRVFGLGIGTTWSKDKHAIINSCLCGLESLLSDPNTSLSGLPAKPGGENIYGVVGDVSESTFRAIEREWSPHGVCLYAPAPALKNIYLYRLGNADERALVGELGLPDYAHVNQASSSGGNGGFDFNDIVGNLYRRAEASEEQFNGMWTRMEV